MNRKNILKLISNSLREKGWICVSFFTFIYLVEVVFVSRKLDFTNLSNNSILLFELLDINFELTYPFTIIFSFALIVTGYFLVKKVFSNNLAVYTILIFVLSPWSIYLTVAGSVYIILTFSMIVSFYGIIITKKKPYLGIPIFYLGALSGIYTSIHSIFLFTFLIYYLMYYVTPRIKKMIIMGGVFLIILPMILLTSSNISGIKSIVKKEFSIFSDFGMTNAINQLRGETNTASFGQIGRIVDNKFTYYSRHFIFSILNNLTPVYYFTNQHKLLGFSFLPPIFLGFLIPFLIGVFSLFKQARKEIILIITLILLVLPSVFSKNSPDLEKLFVLFPFISLSVSKGLQIMVKTNNVYHKILFGFCISLIIYQFLVSAWSVSILEPIRYSKYISI